MQEFIKKVSHFLYWLLKTRTSGLDKLPIDARDLNVGIFGWGEYTPKHKVWVIPTLGVKDQGQFNTCSWNATIVQKEIDEGVKLSVRKLVTWARQNGYITKNGFANLRSNQIALQKYGAELEEAGEDQIGDWEVYSNAKLNLTEASKHRTSSFWAVTSKNDLLKLLDTNRIVTTGIDWYSGFNQGGGFSFPWLIFKIIGYLIGGHALPIVGYDLAYQGRKVGILQNSYGKLWGDTRTFKLEDGRDITMSGLLYIDLDYLINNDYGLYTNLDIGVDTGKFLSDYDGKNVKGSGSTIYYIQAGKKKTYPDWVTYLAYDGIVKGYSTVDDEVLNKIPAGDNMDLTKSVYWDFLKELKAPENLQKMIEILSRK